MNKWFILLICLSAVAIVATGCKKGDKGKNMSIIDKSTQEKVTKMLSDSSQITDKERIARGVEQAAAFWTKEDGTAKEFEEFCKKNFLRTEAEREETFKRLAYYYEVLGGNFNKITIDLNVFNQLEIGKEMPVDLMFAAYSPSASMLEDFFKNKIAFYCILNYPCYTLKEKEELGQKWSRLEWAYARLGDMFTSRVPAEINQEITTAYTKADNYISNYNIMMGYLVDDNGKTLFDTTKRLVTHWGLRDELKSWYGKETGLEHQKMIYEVMKRIISQEIPQQVINSNKYQWNPYSNKLIQGGKEVASTPEPNTRYKYLLDNFLAMKKADAYSPMYPDYIKRNFEQSMEIPVESIEAMFTELCSSPTVKKVATIIKNRLGRNLEPFDIWYDGFKARASLDQEALSAKLRAKYPNPGAFAEDMPNILRKLGFSQEKAQSITSKINVDPSRGAGHAIGALMKSDKAHLRTRIGENGMDYKGYNIAIHEFGHTVEQTISLQDVDYYTMAAVPNTSFTEDWAFIFQSRDLELLGEGKITEETKYLKSLDNFWSAYEIMGVSLVDIGVWKWLYKNPSAKPEQLKQAVIKIAKDVWNKYYADVFGQKDQPILAIYSHMIDNPLYLSAYPVGHLIEFQIEQYIEGKNLGEEMQRMLTQGRLTPSHWMKGAVGGDISVKPLIQATEEALGKIK